LQDISVIAEMLAKYYRLLFFKIKRGFVYSNIFCHSSRGWLFFLTAKRNKNSALIFVKMLFVQRANWCITSQK